MPDDPRTEIELLTKTVGDRTETYLRNANTRKTIRVAVRSVCHNPRMNAVTTYDVFPGKERRIADDKPGGPVVTRKIESATYAPPPGRSKDQ